jgi:hypothetical protein
MKNHEKLILSNYFEEDFHGESDQSMLFGNTQDNQKAQAKVIVRCYVKNMKLIKNLPF